jgi:hypothetical protein
VELVGQRSATTKVFSNPDGTLTAAISGVSVHYRDASGAWQDIDSSLIPDTQNPGWLRSKANSWTVRFAPLPTGVVVDTPTGRQTIAPAGVAGVTLVPGPGPNQVTYPNVWPNVDLRYTVSAAEVKEDLILKAAPGRSSFDFSTGGLTYQSAGAPAGGLAPVGLASAPSGPAAVSAGAGWLVGPEVNDAGGRPLPGASAASPTLTPTGSGRTAGVRVAVDSTWLAAQPASAFPLVIDPTIAVGSANMTAYKSDGWSGQGYGLKVGNSMSGPPGNPDTYLRSVGYFDYTPYFGDQIQAASVTVSNRIGASIATSFYVFWASAYSFAGAIGSGSAYASGTIPGSGAGPFTIGSQALAQLFSTWTVNRTAGGALGFAGTEGPGLYSDQDFGSFVVNLTYNAYPGIANPTAPSPGNGASIHSLTPSFGASAGDSDGDAVQYYYRVALNSDAETNVVWNSGWTGATSPAIPTGVLAWNTVYYWQSGPGTASTTPGAISCSPSPTGCGASPPPINPHPRRHRPTQRPGRW